MAVMNTGVPQPAVSVSQWCGGKAALCYRRKCRGPHAASARVGFSGLHLLLWPDDVNAHHERPQGLRDHHAAIRLQAVWRRAGLGLGTASACQRQERLTAPRQGRRQKLRSLHIAAALARPLPCPPAGCSPEWPQSCVAQRTPWHSACAQTAWAPAGSARGGRPEGSPWGLLQPARAPLHKIKQWFSCTCRSGTSGPAAHDAGHGCSQPHRHSTTPSSHLGLAAALLLAALAAAAVCCCCRRLVRCRPVADVEPPRLCAKGGGATQDVATAVQHDSWCTWTPMGSPRPHMARTTLQPFELLIAGLPVSGLVAHLIVGAVGCAGDLSVPLHARHPGLDVVLAVRGCTQVVRRHVQHLCEAALVLGVCDVRDQLRATAPHGGLVVKQGVDWAPGPLLILA